MGRMLLLHHVMIQHLIPENTLPYKDTWNKLKQRTSNDPYMLKLKKNFNSAYIKCIIQIAYI